MPIAILSASYLHNKKIPLLSKRDFFIIAKFDFALKTSDFCHPSSCFYHTLISTSTPEGSSNFISASTVLEEEE